MRRFVRPFLTASIAAAGASILIAAPVTAAPAPDPNTEQGMDQIVRGCFGNAQCIEAKEEEFLQQHILESARTNPTGVDVGASNTNGVSVGALNQNADSPGASSQNPGSPGPTNKNGNDPNGSPKNSH